jgi:hypothetical protein
MILKSGIILNVYHHKVAKETDWCLVGPSSNECWSDDTGDFKITLLGEPPINYSHTKFYEH